MTNEIIRIKPIITPIAAPKTDVAVVSISSTGTLSTISGVLAYWDMS